jgi:hypothetical protein
VFTWLRNLTGISALLVWGSIGLISLRFHAAYRAQGRSLLDLPYVQPFFPSLPAVVVLALLMFIAEGHSAIKEQLIEAKVCPPFDNKSKSFISPHSHQNIHIHRGYPSHCPILWLHYLRAIWTWNPTAFRAVT